MAHGIISIVTATSAAEAALVLNADGSPVSSPAYADCTLNSDGTYSCATDAPAGTYPVGAQLMRLKASPSVTAGSIAAATVSGTSSTGATGSTTTVTPQTSGYAFTEQRADRNGHPFPDSLAEYSGTTDATSLTVRLHTNSPYQGTLAVFVNDAWFAAFLTQSGGGDSSVLTERVETFAVTGLPSGQKKVTLDPGAVGRDDSQGRDYFWQWLDFDVPAGNSWTPLGWTKKTGELLVTLSDSIGVEATCQPGKGWVNQLRRKPSRGNTDVVALGYGGASPQVLIGSPAAIQAVVSRVVSLAAGYGTVRFVVALGTNLNGGYGASNLQSDLSSLGNALAGAGIANFTLANDFFIQIVPPNASPSTTDYSSFRSAQNAAAQALGARTVDAWQGLTPNSSGIHFDDAASSANNTIAANRYDAALVDLGQAASYHTVDSQSFETGTYPSSYNQRTGFALTSERVSGGAYAVKQTLSASDQGVGPTTTTGNGRFGVDIYLGPSNSGKDYYPLAYYGQQPNGSCYFAQASVAAVSGQPSQVLVTFYCQRKNGTTNTALKTSGSLTLPAGWYRFVMGRVAAQVTMQVIRLADGFYTNPDGIFAATPSVFFDAADSAPLTVAAGTSTFAAYLQDASDVAYYDNALLESYS